MSNISSMIIVYLLCSVYTFQVIVPVIDETTCQEEWDLHEPRFAPYQKQVSPGVWRFDRDAYCKEVKVLYLGEAMVLFAISPLLVGADIIRIIFELKLNISRIRLN